jgi:hypothetical protein
MQRVVRSSVTAGVALFGAGIIAASPIAPPVPNIHLPAIHFDATTLAAAVSPIDAYKAVFQAAAANLQALADAGDPGEVIKQIAANQVASLTGLGTALGALGTGLFTALSATTPELLKTVVTSLAAGNVEAATNALLTVPLAVGLPLISFLPAVEKFITQPFQNLLNVAGVFRDPLQDGLYVVGLLGPVITGLSATGAAMQNVIDAVHAGDPQQVVNALLTGPATIIGGILNGGYGPDLGPLVGSGFPVLAGGLLSLGGFDFSNGITLNVAGPLGTLQTLAHQIALALKPPAAAAAAAVHAKALTAASTTTETSATTETPAKADGDATATPSDPKAAAKPVRHKPSATSAASATNDGSDKGDSANGPKHAHKAEHHGHKAH